jgi:hypothetical protein
LDPQRTRVRCQPGAGQVGAEIALLLAAGDEPLDAGHGLVVVAADASGGQIALGGGQQAAVLGQDRPGGADQARQCLGGCAVVDRLGL